MSLTPSIRDFIATGPLAHVVTLGPAGDPHVTMAWVGIEDDEVVIGTLHDQTKLQNLRGGSADRDVIRAPGRNAYGLDHYLVLRGQARVTEGGAADLLQRLAHVYLGPDVVFPGMPNPPPGYVIRMTVERISGMGDWD